MNCAALHVDANVLSSEAAVNRHVAHAATQGRERGGWNLDKGVGTRIALAVAERDGHGVAMPGDAGKSPLSLR